MEHTILVETETYNEKRWSRPWAATINIDEEGEVSYDFNGKFIGEHGYTGSLVIKAETSAIIAFGQKDNRRGNSINKWFKVCGSIEKIETDETFRTNSLIEISRSDAVKLAMGL